MSCSRPNCCNMSGKILIFFFITQVTVILSDLQLKCKPADKGCLIKAAQAMVPTFTAGMPEIGIESLDVMHIDKIDIDIAGLKLAVNNVNIKGLKKTILEKIDLNMDKKLLTVAYHVDIGVKGKYTASGRIIILPISGDGDCNIKLKKIYVELIMPFDIKKNEDGKDVIRLKGLSYNYDVKERAHFDLQNLFNGNEGLSVPLLKFMNENWKLITQEFGKAILEKPHSVIYEAIKKYLGSQPLDNLIVM